MVLENVMRNIERIGKNKVQHSSKS